MNQEIIKTSEKFINFLLKVDFNMEINIAS